MVIRATQDCSVSSVFDTMGELAGALPSAEATLLSCHLATDQPGFRIYSGIDRGCDSTTYPAPRPSTPSIDAVKYEPDADDAMSDCPPLSEGQPSSPASYGSNNDEEMSDAPGTPLEAASETQQGVDTDHTTDDHSSAVKTAMTFVITPGSTRVSEIRIGTLPPFLDRLDVPSTLGKRHRDEPEVSNKRRR